MSRKKQDDPCNAPANNNVLLKPQARDPWDIAGIQHWPSVKTPLIFPP